MIKKLLLIFCCLSCFSCHSKPKVLWQFATEGYIYSSPSISKNLVIIGSGDSYLYALDHSTGKLIWKKGLAGPVLTKPLIYPDAVITGGGKNLYALNPDNGNVIWEFPTIESINYNPCGDEEAIYFGNNGGQFLKVSRQGKLLWEFKTKQEIWGDCKFYKDQVLTSAWDSNCYSLERATGNVKWKVSSGKHNYGGPEIFEDTVFFGSHNLLLRMNADTGKILWEMKTGYLDHVVVYDNFLWTTDGGLKKRNLEGKIIQEKDFTAFARFEPIAQDGFLIVTDTKKTLHAISTDLKTLWEFEGEDAFWSPGVIYNNVYYTGNKDKNVYALQLPK